MVTFSIPGDDDVEATSGTPSSRPRLPFAKRAYAAASPFGCSSAKRLATLHASTSRRSDEVPSSSLNKSSIASARNIFLASASTNSPPTSTFSPTIPNSAMKKVFAPGATPEPSRVYREVIAHATPRGMAAKTTSKELFPMRIASPPPELTGEVLTQKVPKEWNAKGSIYADQFLAHLCPPELDEEQRRQFFCILDLRRLKYAANEIFARKDWKLNVINFAKEFEKSRSIILLRYGLYEFQNVKPSKDVLKRWRREHGLPDPDDEEADASTPSRPTASNKRKASDDDSVVPATPGKRRPKDQPANNTEYAASTSTPSGKNKRKASVGEEQPNKMQKSTPSSAKSLFEKIANKSPVGFPPGESTFVAKPSAFTANKPAISSNLARSVFTKLKPPEVQNPSKGGTGGSNLFGYLSDASTAKNSGVDADAEIESDSEQDDSQEAGHSDEHSLAISGAGDASSQFGSRLFSKKHELPADRMVAGLSSAPDTREPTPCRSLFDRVTRDNDGQPVRVEERSEETEAAASVSASAEPETEPESQAESRVEPIQEKPAIADQTWNPTTTPIKFAPSTASAPTSFFGASSKNDSSSIFAPKTTAPSNLFSAAKQDEASNRDNCTGADFDQAGKDGGESDKENESQPAKKALFGTKAPAGQSAFGSSLFTTKPASPEALKHVSDLPDGSTTAEAPKIDAKAAEASTTPSHFGESAKPPEAAASSLTFGAKAAEMDNSTVTGTPNATSLFGGDTSKAAPEPKIANSLFGARPPSTASSLFGSGTSFSAQRSVFGSTSAAAAESTAATKDAPRQTFGFSNTTTSTTTAPSATASKPLFGAPKSPPAAAAGNDLFGSPMKQDDSSPVKKKVRDSSKNGDLAAASGLGNGRDQPAGPNTSTNLFGASSAPAQSSTPAGAISFGRPSSNTGFSSGSFKFNFGGGASTATTTTTAATGFNNPFALASGGASAATSAAPSTGGTFVFGAGSSAPSGTSSPFQFGGSAGGTNSPTPVFGASQGRNTAAPTFGGAGTAPSFNFPAGGAAPQGTGSVFGSNQAAPVFNLQPPAGGSTTTGTNSPLNFGGGSSLATTPAAGTPEPSAQEDAAKDGDANNEDDEKHEQISLVDAVDDDEEVLHEVRAKVLKFVPASETSEDADDKPKSKSPWSTQGVGQLRLLKHKRTKLVRLVLRAEPRGHVALNRAVLPNMSYKADEKYVKLTTSNEKGNGLETWMIQVKTKDLANDLATAMEKNKEPNDS